jgi:hypothetical protein
MSISEKNNAAAAVVVANLIFAAAWATDETEAARLRAQLRRATKH